MKRNRWMAKNAKPARAGWHHVRESDGSYGARYYDDSAEGSWWATTARDGWTPNDSFVDWLLVPEIHS